MVLPEILESQNRQYKSKEEILSAIYKFKTLKGIFNNEQLAIKLIINSMYGAIANIWFAAYNVNIAAAVTLQGQSLIKFAEKILNDYFLNEWHLDYDLHEKLGLTKVKKLTKPVVIYIDTDSVDASSNIRFKVDELGIESFICIKDMFELWSKKSNITLDSKNNEYIETKDLSVMSYDQHTNINKYSKVKKIIRHKVNNKSKYLIKSYSGKEVIVTGDHSIIIKRDGNILNIKPSEIIMDDILIEYN